MSLVQATFIKAAAGRLKLHHAGSRTDDLGLRTLSFTGWHSDGTPFAFVSAPFKQDLVSRTREIVNDLITAHHGSAPDLPAALAPPTQRDNPMPSEVKSLSEILRQAKAKIAEAPKVAEKLSTNVDDLDQAMQMVNSYAEEIKSHTAEVRGLLGGLTNGGPASDSETDTNG